MGGDIAGTRTELARLEEQYETCTSPETKAYLLEMIFEGSNRLNALLIQEKLSQRGTLLPASSC